MLKFHDGRPDSGEQSLALVVHDYDEAIAWFTGVLGFTLVADQYQPEQDKRWVLVAPPGAGENADTLLRAGDVTPCPCSLLRPECASSSSY